MSDHEQEYTFCPLCGGEAHPLGVLGSVVHWLCRYCGAAFNSRDKGE